jgi:hypothetical protein
VADAPALKKPKPKTISDWINRPRSERLDPLKARTELSEALTQYVQQNGGWVTSVPGAKNMRIEMPQNSSLPTKLLELGYDPRHCGIGTRIEAGKFLSVDVIEVSLPGK